MNEILVTGSTKSKRELVFNAAAWYINNYMPRMRTLDIEISITKLDPEYYGFCLEGDTNREFQIEVSKILGDEDLVTTVIHEMIHVKQYARRELQQKGGKHRWKSKWFGEIDYMDQPWEREAHRLDAKLAEMFFSDYRK